jgi:hypothetical protein
MKKILITTAILLAIMNSYGQEKVLKLGFQIVPNVTFTEGESPSSGVAIGVGGIYSFDSKWTTINSYNFSAKSATSILSYNLHKDIQPYVLYRSSFALPSHYTSLGMTTPLMNNDNTYLGYIEVGRNWNNATWHCSIGVLIPIMKKFDLKRPD